MPAGILGSVVSSYILTVTSAGCLSKPIVTVSNANPSCGNTTLSSSNPVSTGTTTYQWVRDGITLTNATTSASFTTTQTGDYYVRVRNSVTNYNDSSAVLPVTVLGETPTITSPNSSLCGSNTSAALTANVTNNGGTFQWFQNNTPILNATGNTYTAASAGVYLVEYTLQGCTSSSSISVNKYGLATLTTLSGANYQTATANQPIQVKATFTGEGPWNFQVYDGSNFKSYTAITSPYTFTVTPEQNRTYSFSSLRSSSCTSWNTNSLYLFVDPTTSVTLPTPANLNVCAGSTIEIPYTTVGTWKTQKALTVELYTASGNYISNSYQTYFSESPIRYTIPSTVALNSTLKVRVGGNLPYFSSVQSTYQLTVTGTGCAPTATIRNSGSNVGCNVGMYAYPSESGYQYQWFKDGSPIGSLSTSNYLNASQSGSYTVQITNASLGYSSTSAPTNVTVTGWISQITPSVATCGTFTLNATPADTVMYTYQWYDPNNNLIAGGTLPVYNTSVSGTYQVLITHKNNSCSSGASYSINANGNAAMSNVDNSTNTVNITSGQSVTLRVTMTGQSPYTFVYSDGFNLKRVTTNNSVYDFSVTPSQNTRYSLVDYTSSCGSGNISGSVTILIDPSVSVTLPTPVNLNVCAGSTIEIPYTTVGAWKTDKALRVELYTASGSYVSNSSQAYSSESPIHYTIPTAAALNSTFKVQVSGILPYFNSVLSTYQLTVTNTGCLPNPVILQSFPKYCNSTILYVAYLSGYNYEWKVDGVTVSSSTNNSITAVSGNYTVRVTGPNNYDRTSAAVAVNIGTVLPIPVISSTGNACTNGSNFTLSSSVTDPSYTYQWYFAPSSYGPFLPVAGGISPALTTDQQGVYFITIENGTCQTLSNTFTTCPLLVSFRSTTICQGGYIGSVSFVSNFSTSSTTLQLVDATNGTTVVASLATMSGFSSTFTNIAVPVSVPAGTYRFVVKSASPAYISSWSAGILTVTNSIAPAAPTLTVMPATVTSGQSSALTVSGCTGTVRWNDNTTTAASRTITPTATTTYAATCTDANGCTSAPALATVELNCDPLEPNNTFQEGTVISAVPYTGPDVCLSSGTDQDWYIYVNNNRVFYILVRPFSINNSGAYKLNVSLVNDTLRLETLPGNNLFVDTYIELYSDTNSQLVAKDDDSGINSFSLLSYKLPAPCPQNLGLYSTILDISPNQSNTARALNIIATNKVGNGSTANYYGQNSVLLSPGFETKISNGGVFKAEVKGCND